jgi:phosphonate ABC transporter permease subunit PhnE
MKNNNAFKSLRLALLVMITLVIYAYGFQVTQVSLKEINETRRQESFFRILRALAHPDLLEYDRDEFTIEVPIYVPCPQGTLEQPAPDTSAPYMIVTPPCAPAKSEINVEGFNFEPNTTGPLNFIPPSGVSLQLGAITTDNDGHFSIKVKLPNRQPVEEAQYIRAITRRNVGLPHFTRSARETWAKIIETVFLALLATTFGVFLSVPISFLAARNLMKDVTSPMSSAALTVMAWPAGVWVGLQVARWASALSETLNQQILTGVAGLIISPVIAWVLARWALPQEEIRVPSLNLRLARMGVLLVAALAAILGLFLLSYYGRLAGEALAGPLRDFGFLGSFVGNLGEILGALLTLLVSLAFGALFGSFGGKLGMWLNERTPRPAMLGLNTLLGAAAGAVVMVALGSVVKWLYELSDPFITFWGPAITGALIGLVVVFFNREKDALPVGLTVYTVTRTILNTLRSIEAFIMAIIFVTLVSTGPFAGVMALSLHTVAALAKLYSEQVESILPGPLEAIRATGATRLQTIVYAVIPQIVPPYISFTIYRWDINVRMSTIIGFAGGGGIGFLLQQNINLLNYRAASVQMLAITVVVALMDMISSKLRQRVV